jgi:hypothetical protein
MRSSIAILEAHFLSISVLIVQIQAFYKYVEEGVTAWICALPGERAIVVYGASLLPVLWVPFKVRLLFLVQ